jgi:hypothetical protein
MSTGDVMVAKPLAIGTALGFFCIGCAVAQNIDPQEYLSGLMRQLDIESQQRFEGRQRERVEQQQEEAYDSRMCVAVGYAAYSPDYYQCIRDSAAYRRNQQAPDFSAYGRSTAPASGAPHQPFGCVTLGDGLGGGTTDCE